MITKQTWKIGDCVQLSEELQKDSVDLIVTSPPYYNEKEYSQWGTYREYLADAQKWLMAFKRILKPGHRLCWNVSDIYSKSGEIIPLSADYHVLFRKCGYLLDTTIIWNKTLKSAGKTNWGSWLLPSNPCVQSYHEYILVYKKEGQYVLPENDIKKASKIPKDLFYDLIKSVWSFRQVTTKNGHPAPFPEELAKRCILFYSFIGDLILDPFVGSGTTLRVCRELNRNGLGFELNPEYETLIKKCLMADTPSLESFAPCQGGSGVD